MAAAIVSVWNHVEAFAQSHTSTQFWPGYRSMSASSRKLLIFLNISWTADRGNLEGQLGIHIDHKLTDIFSVRAYYRFGGSLVENDPTLSIGFFSSKHFSSRFPKVRASSDCEIFDRNGVSIRVRESNDRTDHCDRGPNVTPYASGESSSTRATTASKTALLQALSSAHEVRQPDAWLAS